MSKKEDKTKTLSATPEEVRAGSVVEKPIGELAAMQVISTVQGISKAVQTELGKANPNKELLDSYSKLYSSLATIMGLYRATRFSFSLTMSEFMIIVVWFIGSTVAAWLAIIAGLRGSDVATVIASWTAVLLGLIGVAALSSAKK